MSRALVSLSLPLRVASWRDRMPAALRDAMAPGSWIAGAVLASSLSWWLTTLVPLALTVGLLGLILAAWRIGAALTRSRHALHDATHRLTATEDVLRNSQKMEAIGRLTVGIAHDFNNQLTVISANVEMLKRHWDGREGRIPRHADAAMQGVQRAAALASRLLSLSRNASLEREAVDVNRLIGGVADMLRRGLGERVGLDIRPSETLCFVWADVNRMENALLSLAVAVCERAGDGGTVSIGVEPVRLDVAFAAPHPDVPPGEYVQITLEGPDASQAPGAMVMARALVKEMGGCLLSSHSASCRVLLPRYVPPSLATAVPRPRLGLRATILVVEDDAAVRAACVEVLRELEYEVLDAPDAMEAFRVIADQGGVDLLFTDIGLPGGVSGRALADAARQVDGGMRVVFTSGYPSDDPPNLLCKPFTPSQLARAVREALDTRLTAGD